MSEAFYDYKKELGILGITNQSQLTVKYIEKTKRRLLYKYHTNNYQNFSKEDNCDRRRTEEIIDAASKIVSFLEKNTIQEDKKKKEISISVTDIQKMQEVLLGLWEKIREKNYKFNEKVTILSNGWPLKDMLHRDLEKEISLPIFISIFGAALMYSIAFLLLGVFIEIKYGFIASERVGSFFGILFFIHLISTVIALLPLSRLWLPERIKDILGYIINTGIYYYNFSIKVADFF